SCRSSYTSLFRSRVDRWCEPGDQNQEKSSQQKRALTSQAQTDSCAKRVLICMIEVTGEHKNLTTKNTCRFISNCRRNPKPLPDAGRTWPQSGCVDLELSGRPIFGTAKFPGKGEKGHVCDQSGEYFSALCLRTKRT